MGTRIRRRWLPAWVLLSCLAACGGEQEPARDSVDPGADPAEASSAPSVRETQSPTPAEMARFRSSVQRGVDFMNQRRFKEAVGELSIAAGIQPENEMVLLFLGTSQARIGDYKRAARVLKQAVELAPDSAGAHYELAQVSISLGDLDMAQIHSEIALDLDQDNQKVLELVGQVKLRRGDLQGALEILEPMVAAGPAREDSEFILGLCYQALGRNEDAREIFRKTTQQNPEYTPGWYRLGQVLEALGDVSGAESARATFKELGGTPPPTLEGS